MSSNQNIPNQMTALLLMGHGGLDQLNYCHDVPVPQISDDEVLIQVHAAGVNNTDINTRIAWYSKSVTTATNEGGDSGFNEADDEDGSWSGEPLRFPRIQGADCCGTIIKVGANVDANRLGNRVMVRPMQDEGAPFYCSTFGSEMDGGFAQFAKAQAHETYDINCDWSDIELASIPCAYSTAEGMLHRSNAGAERILIRGASGGVGSAAIQLAKRRGATVVAQADPSKAQPLIAVGADMVVDRDADLVKTLGSDSIDLVVDLVAGNDWPELLKLLKRGGRYVASGAIAGPLVELDVRTLYLKDLTLFGSTYQERVVFENLIRYIENGEIQPLVAKSYPLSEFAQAQQDFLAKKFIGKLVLVPPA